MKIVCLAFGKKHEPELQAAIQKYTDRLSRYADFNFQLVPSGDKSSESAQILKTLKPDDYVILLDETGNLINNQELVDKVEELQLKGTKRLVLIIGGAYGVNDTITARSDQVCSLSGLVFPHQIVRLVLVEQLYRTYNIIAGGKYHHD
jgi:23S rRNA (pseudouridine1915-N3)-methyltransferase